MAVRPPANSPFVPGSDQVPRVWAGRSPQLADWHDKLRARRLAGTYERDRALLGPPGIGKSVLVNRIAAEASTAGDLVAPPVRVPRGADVLALVAESLTALANQQWIGSRLSREAGAVVDRVRRIGAVEFDPAGSDPNPHRHLYQLLVEVGRLAAADGVAVLLRIDEVQNTTDRDALSQLLIAFGDALAHEDQSTDAAGNPHQQVLPLAVYLTGLPDFLDVARSAGATFARRFEPVELEPLTDAEIDTALAPFRRYGFEVLTDEGPAAVFMQDDAIATLERVPDSERAVLEAVGTPLQRLDLDRAILRRRRPITFRMRTVEAYLTGDWPG